jgi:hypothetical protein
MQSAADRHLPSGNGRYRRPPPDSSPLLMSNSAVQRVLPGVMPLSTCGERLPMINAENSDAAQTLAKWYEFAGRLSTLGFEIFGKAQVPVTEKNFAEPALLALALPP